MNKYVVKTGQNIYDVALVLYGSIEGIFDLLVSNSDISFNTTFSAGMTLNYHDDFVVNQDIVSYFDTNNIKVKNGQYEIGNVDVRSEIKNWITKTNSKVATLYQKEELAVTTTLTEHATLDTFDWDKTDVLSPAALDVTQSNTTTQGIIASNTNITPISPQDTWQTQYLDKQDTLTTDKEKLDFASTLTGVKFEKLDSDNQLENLSTMYSNGMIIVPSDATELESYYDNAATPKMIIQQSGANTAINMQIPSNNFVVIDWGDDSSLDFYHYKSSTIKATHTYSDSEEHAITMYGHNSFTNLDLSKVNGVYYALSEIYISKNFVSNYPNAKSLNKLFIIKDK
jgi:hypothetical protein